MATLSTATQLTGLTTTKQDQQAKLARARKIKLTVALVLGMLLLRGLESGTIQAAVAGVRGNLSDDRALHLFSDGDNKDAYQDFTQSPSGKLVGDSSAKGEIVLQTKMMEVTAYCACTHCCGKNARGVTASGKPVSYNGGKFVAADLSVLNFGTQLRIPGYADAPVEVVDTGSAIVGNRLDVFFDSHEEALQWGRQTLPVKVVMTFE